MADALPMTRPGLASRTVRRALRVGWVAIRLGLVIYFGRKGTLFFYQGF